MKSAETSLQVVVSLGHKADLDAPILKGRSSVISVAGTSTYMSLVAALAWHQMGLSTASGA